MRQLKALFIQVASILGASEVAAFWGPVWAAWTWRYPLLPRIPIRQLVSCLHPFPLPHPPSSSHTLLSTLHHLGGSPPPGSFPAPPLPSCWSLLTPEPALSSTALCCLLQRGKVTFEHPADHQNTICTRRSPEVRRERWLLGQVGGGRMGGGRASRGSRCWDWAGLRSRDGSGFPRQSADSGSPLGTSARWFKGWEWRPEGLLIWSDVVIRKFQNPIT